MSNDHRPPAHTPPVAPQDEPWAELRALTAARIALPRAGASLATAPQLDLRLAHARARDTVHAQLDEARLVAELAPLVVVRQGRVAIGDEIARAVRADIAVVLIGERPGLSAPDSMGAYLTFRPTPQTTDADRNCISNIRPEGLAYADAAVTLTHLLRAMRARQISGVRLKDDRLLLDGG
jgi:ethanolamine ammonia-lyase small subunit